MLLRSYIEELEFDLPSKLLEELVSLFDEMPAGQLNEDALQSVNEEQGVYQLFKDGQLVYIGKTDSDAGLKKRLQRHSIKIQSRLGLEVGQVTFKAIRVFVFTAMDLESLLIKHYKSQGQRPEWQHSGFGSNDPGRERDTTKVKEENFDSKHPIDLDARVSIESDHSEISVADMLSQAKKQLSYNIRFQTAGGRKPHSDLSEASVALPSSSSTVRELLKLTKGTLGGAWQITALPGYIIIYREKASTRYPSGKVIE
jgi:hypothetical protein